MAAWLVTEDPQQLIRIDSIVSVNPVPMFPEGDESWREPHPSQRYTAADHVQIVVGTQASQEVRALSCPGYAAWPAVYALVATLAELSKHDPASAPVFVYGPRGSQARWDRELWTIDSDIPKPDYLPRW
ncbi:hypothetical protein AB0C27_53720 [Nonomuraea sp. NPDC048882]|uniref:hypothetical protein n=1 Tax=Nonomuraea sp. NPDC048882 TaxID=3154347 RepID=UPI0033CEB102